MLQSAVERVLLDRTVQLGPCQYPVLVRTGPPAHTGLARAVRQLGDGPVVLLAADRTPPCWAAETAAALPGARRVASPRLLPEPTPDTVLVVLGDRRWLGSVLAQAGPARVVYVPTTLAAMCGASVPAHADATGRPHAPALVWCRPDLLHGPQHAGLHPLLRDVLAVCPYHYASVARRLRVDGRYRPDVSAEFIALCVEAQSGVLAFDPLGRGPGAVLRYGRGRPQGLLLAARLARRLGLLDAAGEAAHRELLARAGLPGTLTAWGATGYGGAFDGGLGGEFDGAFDGAFDDGLGGGLGGECGRHGGLLAGLGEDGSLELVLLTALGRPRVCGGSPLTRVEAADLRAVLPTPGPGLPATRDAVRVRVPAPLG